MQGLREKLSISLLYGAIPLDIPAPFVFKNRFFITYAREEGAETSTTLLRAFHTCSWSFLMAVNDEDFPLSYLIYIIGVILVMMLLVIGGFILWLR